jgi:hypothetical protein
MCRLVEKLAGVVGSDATFLVAKESMKRRGVVTLRAAGRHAHSEGQEGAARRFEGARLGRRAASGHWRWRARVLEGPRRGVSHDASSAMLATQDIERARQVPEVDATQRAQGSARDLAVAGPGSVLVAVKDNGTGPDPAVEERMFQPFFTTKPDGLGMGLAICRSIVEAHGGGLWAAPRAPQGADVRFTERRQCADCVEEPARLTRADSGCDDHQGGRVGPLRLMRRRPAPEGG